MSIKVYKPVTPGQRHKSGANFAEQLTKDYQPEKSLLVKKQNHGGRNAHGKITVRHQGGGNRQHVRIVDFKRNKHGIPAKIDSIQYDPIRSARLALLVYSDGEKAYIIAPQGLNAQDTVMSGPQAEVRPGNNLPIARIPVGTLIHNLELKEGKGGQLVRSAGTAAQVLAKEGNFAQVRLPSGEVRLINQNCYATVGQVGNLEHSQIKLGKAGLKRHMGIRPSVRGSAMSPRDHPHGGGEGRSPIGMPGPKSPWGKPTLGYRTRRNKRTDKYIVKRRNAATR